MLRVIVAMVVSVVLVLPAAATAAPPKDVPADTAADAGSYPHADSDGNRISDALDAVLLEAGPADRTDVIATFEDQTSAGNSEQTLPEQALHRRFTLISGFNASLSKGQITALSHQPGIIRVEENFVVEATNDSANADFGTALARTDYGVDGSGVGICIPDTGYDPAHEQLDDPGKLVGWFDAINGVSTPYDDQGHGTHVAGTAAGAGTGGPQAATYRGVAPAATIYATKVLNSAGSGTVEQIEAGIEWCVAQAGVDVISMSLGTTTGSDGLDALSQAVNAAVDAGKIAVIAAGNSGDGPGTVGSPGAAEKAITVGAAAEWSLPVGASNHSNGVYLAPFSSRGPTLAPSSLTKPDISAPGVSITSASAGTTSGYGTGSGTSMATPFTAGTIALILDADSTLTYFQVIGLLQSTAQDRGTAGKDNEWGWGLIDGYALVAAASGDASHTPTVFPINETITGSVESGGVWSHTFTVGPDDLDVPIAATIILDGAPVCAWGSPVLCDLLGGWEWNPDLEARLLDPTSTELALSECPARGDCGAMGHQETLRVLPTMAGEYTIEVFPVTDGGTFTVDLSTGLAGIPDVTAPVISLLGDNPQTVLQGDSYVELGATAFDDVDGDISAEIVIDATGVDTGTVGSYEVLYDVSDVAGNPATRVVRTVDVTVAPPVGAVDFSVLTVESYGAGQDAGSAVVSGGGISLTLEGNAWKKIALPTVVTAGTVLEFDYSSSTEGEIQGIGFDTDDFISSDRTFQLFGTQVWGIQDYATYVSPGVTHYSIPVGTFYTGTFDFLVFVNDHDSAATADGTFTNVVVSQPAPPAGAIDFSSHTVESYSAQDAGTAVVLDDGASLQLSGNAWKKIALPTTVTAGSVLEFDYSSTVRGEIQGIGFDTDDLISPTQTFELSGTQVWGIQDYATYVSPGVTHYEIPVGLFYTGSFDYLVFVNDHDAGATANGTYSNVVIAQPAPPAGAIDFSSHTVESYGAGQDAGTAVVSGDGYSLTLVGNAWKKIALSTTTTAGSVLEFDFSSSVRGEIQGIGFDTDDGISADRTFQVFGTQVWGIQDYATYVSPGVTHYEIPVGTFYTGSFDYLVFVNDHDAGGTANGTYSNVVIGPVG